MNTVAYVPWLISNPKTLTWVALLKMLGESITLDSKVFLVKALRAIRNVTAGRMWPPGPEFAHVWLTGNR